MEIFGITALDIDSLHNILGKNVPITQNNPTTRSGIELLSAAFFLGLLKVTPALIKAITDLLSEIRKTKYVTFKISNSDGSKVIEGVISKEKINALKIELEKFIEEE